MHIVYNLFNLHIAFQGSWKIETLRTVNFDTYFSEKKECRHAQFCHRGTVEAKLRVKYITAAGFWPLSLIETTCRSPSFFYQSHLTQPTEMPFLILLYQLICCCSTAANIEVWHIQLIDQPTNKWLMKKYSWKNKMFFFCKKWRSFNTPHISFKEKR